MPDFLTAAFPPSAATSPLDILLRLAVALLAGGIVAGIYRLARGPVAASGSFPGTLVLLAILIAMVTQVIGDNIARAFSLVGALSIVRFRTVVRDTQDTAYVIFAVVVGMAVGAQHLWVACIGLAIVGLAGWLLSRTSREAGLLPGWLLNVRLNVGLDPNAAIAPALERHGARRELVSVETVRQGIALEVIFDVGLPAATRPDVIVQELNRIEGVQGVSLKRRNLEPD
jgi:uncharacterized membrane protein YhiD involved in acid resistance